MVVPTRELAIQVADDLRVAAVNMRVKVLTVYGGRAYEPQIDALTAGVDIVVGTPGRLLDLAERRHLDLSAVRALVLDEADKMLDLGFLPDVERIVRLTPAQRQTMLFSATMPGDVVTLARRHMRQPTNIRAEGHDAPAPVPSTQQHVFRAHQMDKIEVLARVLQARDRGLTIVFCQTKRAADQVATALASRGFAVATVHGDLGQGQRERALRAFRSGKVDVLTATEVAARGLDVDDVTHVVNYECPDDEMTYVHRIGRTGRAGRHRRRRHVRRLAGHAPLEAHRRRRWAWTWPSRRRPTPPPSTCSPSWTSRARRPGRSPARCGTGPGSRPRPSRTSARPARSARPGAGPRTGAQVAPAALVAAVAGAGRARRRDGPGRRHGRAAAPPDRGGPRGRRGGIRRAASCRRWLRSSPPDRLGQASDAGSGQAPRLRRRRRTSARSGNQSEETRRKAS